MSRIGKQPVVIPNGVEVNVADGVLKVKGPKGELSQDMHANVSVNIADGENGKEAVIEMSDLNSKFNRSLWGTFRALLANMVEGVTNGFQKQLEVNGVGYKVNLQGRKLVLDVGYSHSVDYELPEGIDAEVEKNVITLKGANKQLLGHTAAEIRKIRKPEPYKGKGIKYMDEVIRRKAGKAAKAA